MTKPRLSIIVSVHDDGRFIAQKLASISASNMERTEVLFVHDGAGADVDAARDYCRTHTFARMVQAEPCTLYGAWNAGIDAAAGKYVAYSNCDDLWHPDWPQAIVAHMDATGCDACHTLTYFQPAHASAASWYNAAARLHRCTLPGPNCTWRRSIPLRFDARLRISGDLDFYARLASAGYALSVMRAPHYLMTLHGRNLSASGDAAAVIAAERDTIGNVRWPQSILDMISEAGR